MNVNTITRVSITSTLPASYCKQLSSQRKRISSLRKQKTQTSVGRLEAGGNYDDLKMKAFLIIAFCFLSFLKSFFFLHHKFVICLRKCFAFLFLFIPKSSSISWRNSEAFEVLFLTKVFKESNVQTFWGYWLL